MPRISFNPVRHGWPFSNDFVNHVGPITTRGLCGGMAFAAIDCSANGIEIPRDITLPPEGSALRNYIFDRQLKSLELMMPEFIWQVGGTDSHHDRWARGALNGSHFNILRRFIDNNKPIPIGLRKSVKIS